MREAKFLAGLATILVFIGIYCFKALSHRKVYKEPESEPINSPLKKSTKIILILSGSLSILLGIFLIIQCIKLM